MFTKYGVRMILIDSSVEIIPQKPGIQGIYEQIELAARNCYKSENCIKYDEEGNSLTAKDFVDKIVNVYKHESVAEHGTIYLKVPVPELSLDLIWEKLIYNPRTKFNFDDDYWYFTTNYRVLLYNDALYLLKYICEPTELHEKRITVRVKCSIGISREWNRHRALSISEQSTRYCNYSKDKFNNDITIVKPYWYDDLVATDPTSASLFKLQVNSCTNLYLLMTHMGLKPQEAREILPLCTATEVIYTGFVSDWKHFFELRTAENAHPDIRKLALDLQKQFKEKGII
jgi:thymidylate synthase (FAD)